MRLHSYTDPHGNFGDDLNDWLWPKVAPGLLDDDGSTLFVGIGTLLNERLPPAPNTVVFGSGVGYGTPPAPNPSWDVSCVRGPRSAAALSLPSSRAVTDGAALLSGLDFGASSRRGRVGFMPHHHSARQAHWKTYCQALGLQYIDPSGSVDEVIADIRSCRIVAAEAMHGAITADTLRVPWIPVQVYDHIHEFKWKDWTDSVEVPYEPLQFGRPIKRGARGKQWLGARVRPPMVLYQMAKAAERHDGHLSKGSVLDSRVDELHARLDDVYRRHRGRPLPASSQLPPLKRRHALRRRERWPEAPARAPAKSPPLTKAAVARRRRRKDPPAA